MRYLIIFFCVIFLISCRSVKISKDKSSEQKSETEIITAQSNTAQNNDIQTTQSEQTTQYTDEVEIVPVNENKPIEIKDNAGKVTTITGGKVRIVKSKKDTVKNLSISDKSTFNQSTEIKAIREAQSNTTTQSKQVEKIPHKTPLFWRLWWLWLIIAVLIYLRIKNIIKL
jgi:hypothetical protein